jgi:Na+/H+-dicarboxylate symporter
MLRIPYLIRILYLPLGIMLGLIAGVGAGLYAPAFAAATGWLGAFFMNALKMVILPLIITSVIAGVGRIGDVKKLGRQGFLVLLYFATTTALAVGLGILISDALGFGDAGVSTESVKSPQGKTYSRSYSDLVLSFVSPNLFRSLSEMDILPVLLFCLLLGGALAMQGDRAASIFRTMEVLEKAVIRIVHLILFLAPMGVYGLIAARTASLGDDFFREVFSLRYYVRNVLLGLGIHGAIILPLIYWMILRKNPFRFLWLLFPVLGTAFSTASSSATLPLTMSVLEEKAKIRPETTGFVLPLGATVNMDGTALYEAMAAMFIAHLYGIELDLSAKIIIFFTATLAAIGAAGIPEAGLVTMAIVLRAAGLPLEGIAMILSIDWFLDRCRTAVNVLGDTVGAAILDRYTEDRKSG